MHTRVNVAIDGLAASGKTTLARMLGHRLGMIYLDTGLMYRAVTLEALRSEVNLEDHEALGALARDLPMEVVEDPEDGSACRVRLAGVDVTDRLHAPEVSRAVPTVATASPVRRELVRRQRAFALERGGVILVGRDIATVVLPEAEVKIYLTADLEERARRRLEELRAAHPDLDLQAVLDDLSRRDEIDRSRADSPLARVPEAHEVDTTGLTREEVLDRMQSLVESTPARTESSPT